MKRTRHALRWLLAWVLRLTGAIWWTKRCIARERGVMVLMFHRVLRDEEAHASNSMPGMMLRLATFRRLVAYCRARYRLASVDERGFSAADGLGIAFTFDDGWIDTYRNAFPVLAEQNIPMTVFVCPELVGQSSPFWPERVIASLKWQRVPQSDIESTVEQMKSESGGVMCAMEDLPAPNEVDCTMSWAEIKLMRDAGVTIGSHGNTHQLLTRISETRARQDLNSARERLESELQHECRVLAYPNGDYSADVLRFTEEAGYQLGFTTSRGVWTQTCNPLAIPRANMCEDNLVSWRGAFSPALFDYSVFWNGWRAFRSAQRHL